MWNDVRIKMPEIDKEVLCIERKFGHSQNLTETDGYLLAWWNGKTWETLSNEDIEDNPDYFMVVYWMDIPKK